MPAYEDCRPLSFCTYNYGALTPKVEPEDYRPRFAYIADWPGVIIDPAIRDEGGNGFVVPGFSTKEAGAGIWWYWMMRRADGLKGYGPNGKVTLRKLSMDYAGTTNVSSRALRNYFVGYQKHARNYFGRSVSLDEALLLNNPDTVWNIARTMFHHEAGLPVTDQQLTRRQFEAGRELADRILKNE